MAQGPGLLKGIIVEFHLFLERRLNTAIYLVPTSKYYSIFKELPDYPSLDILPVGVLQPTPTELLGTERFAKMIASLRKQYELVIIDTPQVDGLADTEILEQYADATLFITRAGLLRRQRLNELEEAQQKGKYKGLTVVVNGTENELQSI